MLSYKQSWFNSQRLEMLETIFEGLKSIAQDEVLRQDFAGAVNVLRQSKPTLHQKTKPLEIGTARLILRELGLITPIGRGRFTTWRLSMDQTVGQAVSAYFDDSLEAKDTVITELKAKLAQRDRQIAQLKILLEKATKLLVD